jgi:phosphoribosyl 1,2-cyclic phosphodiesterase
MNNRPVLATKSGTMRDHRQTMNVKGKKKEIKKSHGSETGRKSENTTHCYHAASDVADKHVFVVFPRNKQKIRYPDTEVEIQHYVNHVYSLQYFNIDTQKPSICRRILFYLT